jgi:integrase
MPATPTTTLKKTRNRKPGAKVYRLDDGRWMIRYKYTDPQTRRPVDIKRTARGRTKTEALTEARALERQVLDAMTRDPAAPRERPPVPTVREFLPMFLDYCRSEGKAPATIRNYNQHLVTYALPVVGDRRLNELGPADAAAINKRHIHLSQYTRRQVVASLNRMLSVAAILGESPELIRLPKLAKPEHKPEAYSAEQAAALLDGFESQRDLVMLYLGIVGGLRRGEVCAVRSDDFEEVGDGLLTLTIQRSVWCRVIRPTKTKKIRTITLTPDASAAIRAFIADFDAPGWLFPSESRFDEDGQRLCIEPSAYVRVMRRLCTHLGVPYKATHILRKTCATALAKAGLGPWAIADHLGHSGTEMAQVYVDRYNARNDRVASALAAYTAGARPPSNNDARPRASSSATPPGKGLGNNKGVHRRPSV